MYVYDVSDRGRVQIYEMQQKKVYKHKKGPYNQRKKGGNLGKYFGAIWKFVVCNLCTTGIVGHAVVWCSVV